MCAIAETDRFADVMARDIFGLFQIRNSARDANNVMKSAGR
jgi:hypothetical protein